MSDQPVATEAKSGVMRVAARAPRAPKGKHAIPDDFAVSSDVEALCRRDGLPNPHDVIGGFIDWARSGDVRKADWEATFKNWMRSDITKRQYPAWGPEPKRVAPPRDMFAEHGVSMKTTEECREVDVGSLFAGLGKIA